MQYCNILFIHISCEPFIEISIYYNLHSKIFIYSIILKLKYTIYVIIVIFLPIDISLFHFKAFGVYCRAFYWQWICHAICTLHEAQLFWFAVEMLFYKVSSPSRMLATIQSVQNAASTIFIEILCCFCCGSIVSARYCISLFSIIAEQLTLLKS